MKDISKHPILKSEIKDLKSLIDDKLRMIAFKVINIDIIDVVSSIMNELAVKHELLNEGETLRFDSNLVISAKGEHAYVSSECYDTLLTREELMTKFDKIIDECQQKLSAYTLEIVNMEDDGEGNLEKCVDYNKYGTSPESWFSIYFKIKFDITRFDNMLNELNSSVFGILNKQLESDTFEYLRSVK